MRHGNKINHLGRKTAHRKALLMNLSNALIAHKRITTTVAKAKELRKHIEPLLNKCKTDTTHNRRILFSYLSDKESIKELFGVIADKIATRPGGYTRIIKLGFRKGDAADIAMIELVDFNEVYKNKSNEDSGKKKSRRGRGGKTSASEVAVVDDQEALIEDAVIVENADTTSEQEVVEEVSVSDEIASTEENELEETAENVVSVEEAIDEVIVDEAVDEVAVEESIPSSEDQSSDDTKDIDENKGV
jgi:large subunit ribosomal protein L17